MTHEAIERAESLLCLWPPKKKVSVNVVDCVSWRLTVKSAFNTHQDTDYMINHLDGFQLFFSEHQLDRPARHGWRTWTSTVNSGINCNFSLVAIPRALAEILSDHDFVFKIRRLQQIKLYNFERTSIRIFGVQNQFACTDSLFTQCVFLQPKFGLEIASSYSRLQTRDPDLAQNKGCCDGGDKQSRNANDERLISVEPKLEAVGGSIWHGTHHDWKCAHSVFEIGPLVKAIRWQPYPKG